MTAKASSALMAVLAAALCGCSIGGTIADMPAVMGGLPAGTPDRPAQTAAYPAVHDMPPERETKVLTDDEQRSLEEDLAAQRDRLGGAAAPPPAKDARGTGTGSRRNP